MRKVKLAFSQLLLFKKALEEFNQLATEAKLTINARVSYVLHKNQTSIYKVYWDFMQKRNELIHKFAELDENNDVKFTIKDETLGAVPENMEVVWKDKESFDKEMSAIMDSDFEVEFFFDNKIHRRFGDMNGEHSLLNKLFEILDIFENYGRK